MGTLRTFGLCVKQGHLDGQGIALYAVLVPLRCSDLYISHTSVEALSIANVEALSFAGVEALSTVSVLLHLLAYSTLLKLPAPIPASVTFINTAATSEHSDRLLATTLDDVMQRSQAGKLVPAEPALLAEAGRWVDSWQEPTGHTNYDAAMQMAERYMEANCEYIFSDGLSDYAVVLLEVKFDACFC